MFGEGRILEVPRLISLSDPLLLSTFSSLVAAATMRRLVLALLENPGTKKKVAIGDSVGGTLPFACSASAPHRGYATLDIP